MGNFSHRVHVQRPNIHKQFLLWFIIDVINDGLRMRTRGQCLILSSRIDNLFPKSTSMHSYSGRGSPFSSSFIFCSPLDFEIFVTQREEEKFHTCQSYISVFTLISLGAIKFIMRSRTKVSNISPNLNHLTLF